MYDRLTPLFRDVTDAQLVPEHRRHRLLQVGGAGRRERPVAHHQRHRRGHGARRRARSARAIKRDAYGVPHIYSDTDAGVLFAAGYVEAADRIAAARPGARQRRRRAHRHARACRPSSSCSACTPTSRPRRSSTRRPRCRPSRSRRRAPQGRQLLSDIDVYLAGINLWYSQNKPDDAAVHAHRHLRAERDQVAVPGPGRRRGGRQRLVPRRGALQARRHPRRRGLRGPARALRPRDGDHDDAQASPYQTKVSVAKPRGMVRLVNGSFRSTAPKLPASTRAAAAQAATVDHPYGPPQLASNILIASGKASQTGSPLFVGGPQIGYNYPGLTLEMDLHGPDIHVRGATSAPFPGYMLIGRGDGLRVDADLGRRRHHRHLRRDAVRRLEGALPLQGQVPGDGVGRRRHDLQGRQERPRHVPAHGPRARSTATRRRAAATSRWRCRRGARATAARRSTSSSSSR